MTTHIEKILSVVSVMRYILPANAGACLSPKDEFAQEHERIRHMYRVGNEENLFIWMVMLQYNPVSPSAGKGIAEWQAVYYNEARM